MICSIITVNYNNQIGLKRTLESVRNQTFVDFEHIIVDGGSTDGSVKSIESYVKSVDESKRYEIIWSSEKDDGVFNAMNKGIEKSRGDYLLFLNSGDFLINEFVLQDVFSIRRDADIVIGKCQVSKEGNVFWIASPRKKYSLDFFFHGSMAHQASFIRRELFVRFGYYREDLRLMSDWAFTIKAIILGGASVEPIDVLVSDYNCDGMSSDSSNKPLVQAEREKVFCDLHLDCIIPDYILRDQETRKQDAMLWAWNKKIIRLPIEFIYHIAKKLI